MVLGRGGVRPRTGFGEFFTKPPELLLLCWPEKRVSGEAVLLMGLVGTGDARDFDADDVGDDNGSTSRMSLSDVLGPRTATCQGEEDLVPAVSTVICGWVRGSCCAFSCCLFRSF